MIPNAIKNPASETLLCEDIQKYSGDQNYSGDPDIQGFWAQWPSNLYKIFIPFFIHFLSCIVIYICIVFRDEYLFDAYS
jgi:hypothetical protein